MKEYDTQPPENTDKLNITSTTSKLDDTVVRTQSELLRATIRTLIEKQPRKTRSGLLSK